MSLAIKQSPQGRPADAHVAANNRTELCSGRDILVSAIVSVYKAGRFIEGCLHDLTRQTLIDRMEIIVVDSASDEGENRTVRSYQEKFQNIIYLRTGARETVYAAWNRGIKLASGQYITNANTDDRHRHDAYEVMASALESRTDVALVYADLLITETENQSFEDCTPTGRFTWLDWDRRKLLEGKCFMGPQPMWRRSLHEEYGYFRSDFITSGDYEFWLRASQTHDFMHLPVVLGLYLKTPTSIEHSNRDAQSRENLAILSEYRAAAKAGQIINRCGRPTPAIQAPKSSIRHTDALPSIKEKPVGLMEAAKAAMGRGDLETVINLLETVMQEPPHPAPKVLECAKLYLAMSAFEDVIALVDQARARNDAHGLDWLKAAAQLGLGEFERAGPAINAMLHADPTDTVALNLKGVLLLEQNQVDSAVACLEAAIETGPGNADALINLGSAYLATGNVDLAFRTARKGFLMKDPVSADLIKITRIIDAGVAAPEADTLYKDAIGAYPANKALLYQYISLLLTQGRHTDAMRFIEAGIVRFGHEDGILQHGLAVRAVIGPLAIASGAPPNETTSLITVLDAKDSGLAGRLSIAKAYVDEIVAIDAGASPTSRQIAQVFGAQIHSVADFPVVQDPWELATQMAQGDKIERLDGER